jgi:exopolysaccharide production protein ExoZ
VCAELGPSLVKRRIQSIDALRGFFALLVCLYHISSWLPNKFTNVVFLNKALKLFGIYAVEGFFVISGVSLMLAYSEYDFAKIGNWFRFFLKRYIRILPLYGLLLLYVHRLRCFKVWTAHCWSEILMLFGFRNPYSSGLTGGWSIGVEFVFYFFFPLFCLLCARNRVKTFVLCALSFVVLCFCVLRGLNYVNPLQHVFFFTTGMWLGVIANDFKGSDNRRYMIAFLVLFILMCLNGPVDQKTVMNEWCRLYWAPLTCCLVFCAMRVQLDHFFWRFLGDISYGVYLIHPIFVFNLLPRWHMQNSAWSITIVLGGSIASAFMIHRFFEVPIQSYLRRKLNA